MCFVKRGRFKEKYPLGKKKSKPRLFKPKEVTFRAKKKSTAFKQSLIFLKLEVPPKES